MTDRQTDRQGGMLEINHLTACIEDEVGMTDRQTDRQGGMLEINHLTACIEDEVGMTDRQTDRTASVCLSCLPHPLYRLSGG